jgi:adenine-specific DNA-methyltransferase
MNDRQQRFIQLLEEIFEINKSDLDFGIYRILNIKREEISTFFHSSLPKLITEELTPFAPTTADMAGLETDVYSALYSFFNRYYDEGDFISKRRYKEGVYALPYEGEEVKLYWANQDQYYIKTSENFKDYTFNAEDLTVHFRLVDATTEQNNNKEDEKSKRVFMLFTEDEENYPDIKTFTYDKVRRELVIRFVYNVPEDKKRKYDEENFQAISAYLAKKHPELFTVLMRNVATNPKDNLPLIRKHLQAYVAKNTFDYFIHKDLKGFLSRELDFYIKNEILHIDDIDSEDVEHNQVFFAKIRAIKRVARILIDFLAQLEEFQKRLWLKKKFVVETNWCITLDQIDEKFYPEIAANEAQTEDWVDLFAIDQIKGDVVTPAFSRPLTVEFLKANTNLVLDTKHFSAAFKDKLVASIDNLDEKTNGVLVNSENFQALRLLVNKYSEKIQCVYIDPPYNTPFSEILYKNNYKHSSWLGLLHNTIPFVKKF